MRLAVNQRLIILLVLAVVLNGGQDCEAQTVEADSVVIEPAPKQQNNFDSQRLDKAYELLYQDSKTAQDRLINTIQWSIGLFLAIITIVIGSQIFFNYRINKEEVSRIESGLNSKVSELKAELFKAFGEKQQAGFSSLKTELDEKVKALSSDLEKSAQIEQIKTEVAIKVQKDELKRLKADIEKNDARLWLLEGVKGNALTAFVRSVSIQLELGYELKYSLEDVIKTLESMERLSDHDVSVLRKLLNDLPVKYSSQKKRIEGEMKDKPVYKLGDSSPFGIPIPGLFGNLLVPFPKSDKDS